MKSVKRLILIWIFFSFFFLAAEKESVYSQVSGTMQNPVTDCHISLKDALTKKTGMPIPEHILHNQVILDLIYYSFDGKFHQGQLVIDKQLAEDIREVFSVAEKERFPIFSVIPVSHPGFQWDDKKSMKANNTSGFNYRNVAQGKKLSDHAYGFAIDLNPLFNPYIKGDTVLPSGSQYIPKRPGTLTPDSPVVKTFLRLGWTWGGNYKSLKDYQHFSKIPR